MCDFAVRGLNITKVYVDEVTLTVYYGPGAFTNIHSQGNFLLGAKLSIQFWLIGLAVALV